MIFDHVHVLILARNMDIMFLGVDTDVWYWYGCCMTVVNLWYGLLLYHYYTANIPQSYYNHIKGCSESRDEFEKAIEYIHLNEYENLFYKPINTSIHRLFKHKK